MWPNTVRERCTLYIVQRNLYVSLFAVRSQSKIGKVGPRPQSSDRNEMYHPTRAAERQNAKTCMKITNSSRAMARWCGCVCLCAAAIRRSTATTKRSKENSAWTSAWNVKLASHRPATFPIWRQAAYEIPIDPRVIHSMPRFYLADRGVLLKAHTKHIFRLIGNAIRCFGSVLWRCGRIFMKLNHKYASRTPFLARSPRQSFKMIDHKMYRFDL